MKLVVIETPFSGKTEEERERNAEYLRCAMMDSIGRGEAPFPSHALYPQFLDDEDPSERSHGMEMGFAWGRRADGVAVYADLGLSRGMQEGIARALAHGLPVTYRSLGAAWVLWAIGAPSGAARYAGQGHSSDSIPAAH